MPQPHYVSETQIVKNLTREPDCRYEWSKHALYRMNNRRHPPATASDVERCLMNGQVVLEENKTDRLWRVKGRDLDGNAMEVVVAVFEDEKRIKVVTVI